MIILKKTLTYYDLLYQNIYKYISSSIIKVIWGNKRAVLLITNTGIVAKVLNIKIIVGVLKI